MEDNAHEDDNEVGPVDEDDTLDEVENDEAAPLATRRNIANTLPTTSQTPPVPNAAASATSLDQEPPGVARHVVPPQHTAYFNSVETWESDKQGMTEETCSVRFGDDFSIRDEYVRELAKACPKLTSFSAGNCDDGHGVPVTDAAIMEMAQHCKDLQKLHLHSHTNITDAAAVGVGQVCHMLEHVEITRHDRSQGKITQKFRQELAVTPALAPNLPQLTVIDQQVGDAVGLLKKNRPVLRITYGGLAMGLPLERCLA
ncbi:uncharacterized protein EV422DRAFT_610357 [Fimicolochytrium jonesii]|uniref:uncharacterized protein n=1 Tax=Fimicolochytrium jonesii TaxID=1396493 RepID=UPI0022FE1ABD|nr:uncharacterized protein EV422DRAFT_610357 [Fimicolochytrium jonesii]KAI8816097.1 hypothetical protein EV422DRAFT_610357 [Fimicolochytrium jonesii]